MNYYNEFDPRAAEWLHELIKEGIIPRGDVDTRSITDVSPDDIRHYTQCHFFAGVGGWPLALALAGWPKDRPVWTGSCPCPPFSTAGKKKTCPKCAGKPMPHPLKTGVFACIPCGYEWIADARHLWPEFFRLISECRPSIVFGEQVAGKDGLIWLAGVRATMEAIQYGVGASDLCAAGAGEKGWGWIVRDGVARLERMVISAPHIRQRLFWVADAGGVKPWRGRVAGSEACSRSEVGAGSGLCSSTGRLADTSDRGCPEYEHESRGRQAAGPQHATKRGCACGMGDTLQPGLEGHAGYGDNGPQPGWVDTSSPRPASEASGVGCCRVDDAIGIGRGTRGNADTEHDGHIIAAARDAGAWSDFDVIPCRDGKARRVESGTFPLAHGIPGRVGLLRGYGNAIVPQVAAEFIKAYMMEED